MTDADVRAEFVDRGFVVLPGLLSPEDLAPAVTQLATVFPTADEFHDDADTDRNARYRTEFGGIIDFPFPSPELNQLAVHDRLIDLAAELLASPDVRLYGAEAWAKYTGAAQYAQPLHRDYLNHSLLVPAPDEPPCQVEMFVYLSDVTCHLGPPAYLPLAFTRELSSLPNWYPRDASPSRSRPPELGLYRRTSKAV